MIGRFLPLCYPQIGASNLLYSRTLFLIWLLTEHIRLVGLAAFFGCFLYWGIFPSNEFGPRPPTSQYAGR